MQDEILTRTVEITEIKITTSFAFPIYPICMVLRLDPVAFTFKGDEFGKD